MTTQAPFFGMPVLTERPIMHGVDLATQPANLGYDRPIVRFLRSYDTYPVSFARTDMIGDPVYEQIFSGYNDAMEISCYPRTLVGRADPGRANAQAITLQYPLVFVGQSVALDQEGLDAEIDEHIIAADNTAALTAAIAAEASSRFGSDGYILASLIAAIATRDAQIAQLQSDVALA